MSAQSPYAARPWEKHYDYWVRPHLSYPGRPLGDILNITAVERPDRVATQFLGAQLTYLELKRRADALAASLASCISTNAKPRARPVSRSMITFTDSTAPCGWKSERSSLSVTLKGRFPTYSFLLNSRSFAALLLHWSPARPWRGQVVAPRAAHRE